MKITKCDPPRESYFALKTEFFKKWTHSIKISVSTVNPLATKDEIWSQNEYVNKNNNLPEKVDNMFIFSDPVTLFMFLCMSTSKLVQNMTIIIYKNICCSLRKGLGKSQIWSATNLHSDRSFTTITMYVILGGFMLQT